MSPLDDPNGLFYGPVRRLFVVVSACFADLPDLMRDYFREWGKSPYHDLVELMEDAWGEAEGLREIVQRCIIASDNA